MDLRSLPRGSMGRQGFRATRSPLYKRIFPSGVILTRIDAGLDFRWPLVARDAFPDQDKNFPETYQQTGRDWRLSFANWICTHWKGITSRWWTGNTRSLAATILDIVERRLSYRDLMGFSMNWRKWK